ncbi:MAG: hypothetical protein ACJAYC_001410 [Halieaceae bacterium]|jgi:hypothetical protein
MRVIRRFKLTRQAQSFLDAYAAVSNLFSLGRHKIGDWLYRYLRISAFTEWSASVLYLRLTGATQKNKKTQ